MDIWLLRHAAAEDRPDSGRDSDRALTPEGIERARAVALGLAALEPGIARVITSPYRRARQTADAAATGRWSGTLRAFLPPRVLEKLGEQK
ncbi:MAG: histidine phosphatase family protein [Acidobacteria bacterium]|nr:histidine phosphatase family protein [Acidobacteriota bacterium]